MSKTQFFKAKYIIVWDEGQHKTLQNGYLGVEDDKIEGFYTQLPEGTPYEDLGDAAITPGFINLHSHPAEVYDLRSYREDIGNPCFFESTLYDYAMVIKMGDRAAELQATLNMVELIKSGCTTAGCSRRRLFPQRSGIGRKTRMASLRRRYYTGRGSHVGARRMVFSGWPFSGLQF